MTSETTLDERVRLRYRDLPVPIDDARLSIVDLITDEAPLLPPDEIASRARRIHADVSGLGPLEALCADPTVSDVLVNGPGPVWIERQGVVQPSGVTITRAEIDRAIERMLGPIGVRADRSSPIADGRLADGSRVNVVLPPVALDGPLISIRRFSATPVPVAAFARPEVVGLLDSLIESNNNVVVFGGTGSGKTTLLNALVGRCPADDRIVTVEDAAELRLVGAQVVRLEARAANGEGAGAVATRDLVRAALRLRPDRIVLGEVRGAEALDMIWAMSSGHDGSLSTCHADGPHDALLRLETFALMAEVDLPSAVVRAQIRSAVDVVIGVRRGRGGHRVIDTIHEVSRDGPEFDLVALVTDGRPVAGATRRRHRRRP